MPLVVLDRHRRKLGRREMRAPAHALHQQHSVATAKAAVSWSIPTLTQPVLAPRSSTPLGIALPNAGSGSRGRCHLDGGR